MIALYTVALTPSDIIEIISIICSLITSIIAIIISIKTLKQSTKMLEESSRPYIGIYGISTYMGFRQYYIIIKNFGQSSAFINSLTYSFDVADISKHDDFEPFSHIDGTTMMPGQSYRAAIDFDKVTIHKLKCINFHISYSSGTHTYDEEICLKIDANLGNLEAHNVNKDMPDTKVISETLQDIHIKSL